MESQGLLEEQILQPFLLQIFVPQLFIHDLFVLKFRLWYLLIQIYFLQLSILQFHFFLPLLSPIWNFLHLISLLHHAIRHFFYLIKSHLWFLPSPNLFLELSFPQMRFLL